MMWLVMMLLLTWACVILLIVNLCFGSVLPCPPMEILGGWGLDMIFVQQELVVIDEDVLVRIILFRSSHVWSFCLFRLYFQVLSKVLF